MTRDDLDLGNEVRHNFLVKTGSVSAVLVLSLLTMMLWGRLIVQDAPRSAIADPKAVYTDQLDRNDHVIREANEVVPNSPVSH